LVNVRDHKETEDFGDVEVHENNNEEKKWFLNVKII
jgi:hypothetical protein